MELAYAGLQQLCAPFADRILRVPGPQRDAVSTAFGLRNGDAPNRFLIGLAVLGLLSVHPRRVVIREPAGGVVASEIGRNAVDRVVAGNVWRQGRARRRRLAPVTAREWTLVVSHWPDQERVHHGGVELRAGSPASSPAASALARRRQRREPASGSTQREVGPSQRVGEIQACHQEPWRTHGVAVDPGALLRTLPDAKALSVRSEPSLKLTISLDGVLADVRSRATSCALLTAGKRLRGLWASRAP
jgi:hypothetical protein